MKKIACALLVALLVTAPARAAAPACSYITATAEIGQGVWRAWCAGGEWFDVALQTQRGDGVPTPGYAWLTPAIVDDPSDPTRGVLVYWLYDGEQDVFTVVGR
jgi:hypothetical protein